MIRNLKILLAAAMSLAAFGAFSASGAQAAEFHCAVEPCTWTIQPDGVVPGKTSHQVIVFKNAVGETVSTTCNQLTGQATAIKKTETTLTFTNLAYDGCKDSIGNAYVVRFNGCDYTFTSHGKFGVSCPEGKRIEKETKTGCIKTIGTFADLPGVVYHNIGVVPNREITVSMNVANIPVTVDGTTAQCGFDVTKLPITAEITTASMIFTAETDSGAPVMVDGWWE
jgi:hypothetical protein